MQHNYRIQRSETRPFLQSILDTFSRSFIFKMGGPKFPMTFGVDDFSGTTGTVVLERGRVAKRIGLNRPPSVQAEGRLAAWLVQWIDRLNHPAHGIVNTIGDIPQCIGLRDRLTGPIVGGGVRKKYSAASHVIRFGCAQRAAGKLERWPNKKRPHEARCQRQAVHTGDVKTRFSASQIRFFYLGGPMRSDVAGFGKMPDRRTIRGPWSGISVAIGCFSQ